MTINCMFTTERFSTSVSSYWIANNFEWVTIRVKADKTFSLSLPTCIKILMKHFS